MTALLLAAGLLLPAGAAAVEVHPQTSYLVVTTFMGAAGGGLLGASLGGISRNTGESDVRPFLRWGAAGAVIGGVLGRAVGLDLVNRTRDAGDVPSPSSREAGSCLGAVVGEAAGFALSAALHQPVSRDSREIWAGIALGAFVGAAAGYLLPPMPFLAPPPEASHLEEEKARQRRRMEPLIPEERRSLGASSAFAPHAAAAPREAHDPDRIERLSGALLELEENRFIGEGRLQPLEQQPLLASSPPPEKVSALAASVMNLCLLEGALLGGALGATVGGRDDDLYERVTIGCALGIVAGWSTASAVTRPWRAGESLDRNGSRLFSDMSADLTEGREFSGILIGGLIGTVAGGALGAVLANSTDDFGDRAIAGTLLGGNVLGLVLGRILTRGVE